MTHGAVGSSSTASSAANYTGEPRTLCYVLPQEKTSHTSIQGSSMEHWSFVKDIRHPDIRELRIRIRIVKLRIRRIRIRIRIS
ncbi:hypothetical protein YC2023_010472 [Brassica napus]